MKNFTKIFFLIGFIFLISSCANTKKIVCPTYDKKFYTTQSKKQLKIKSNFKCEYIYYYPEKPKKRYTHERKMKNGY